MSEQLALLDAGRVYRNDREAWELHEALYSRPEYAWPLVQYFRQVLGGPNASGRCYHQIYRAFDGLVVEPCVGGRALVDGLRRYGCEAARVLTGDVRPVGGVDWLADWTDAGALADFQTTLLAANLVVTNPPFSRAVEIVEASWRRCPDAVVAILQRATWYEPTQDRCAWLREHNPDQVTIGRCEFFWPDGTSRGAGDTCSYTWYVFGPDGQGPLGGHHCIIPWKEAPRVV